MKEHDFDTTADESEKAEMFRAEGEISDDEAGEASGGWDYAHIDYIGWQELRGEGGVSQHPVKHFVKPKPPANP